MENQGFFYGKLNVEIKKKYFWASSNGLNWNFKMRKIFWAHG